MKKDWSPIDNFIIMRDICGTYKYDFFINTQTGDSSYHFDDLRKFTECFNELMRNGYEETVDYISIEGGNRNYTITILDPYRKND